MLLLEYKLNFEHDLAELWKKRPLNHSTYLQLYWKLAVLCLCQTNLVKSKSIHLGTQPSLHLSSSEKKENSEQKEGMLFATEITKNTQTHHLVCHSLPALW